jgi:FKBP-type peptidyl-prolyl cis-trans isomerase
LAEIRQQEEAAAAAAAAEPVMTTPGGTRYRDLVVGSSSGRTVQPGNQVSLTYKVLKLGKRSFDGISGEGTVVFSRGYGLEDDEKSVGDKTFVTTVGSPSNIDALNEALVGMRVGGVRRFAVFPSKGWRKPGSACDGGPGGTGAGGELRTDYGKYNAEEKKSINTSVLCRQRS